MRRQYEPTIEYVTGNQIVQQTFRSTNLQEVLVDIMRLVKRSMTRTQLCTITKAARTTIYDNLKQLELVGWVKRSFKKVNGRGRPETLWELIK